MKAYYSHCMAMYGSEIEEQDVRWLEALGFTVVSPNSSEHKNKEMGYYIKLARTCDLIAFRALPDNAISSGVVLEIEAMERCGKPIIEMPYLKSRNKLSYEQTLRRIRQW